MLGNMHGEDQMKMIRYMTCTIKNEWLAQYDHSRSNQILENIKMLIHRRDGVFNPRLVLNTLRFTKHIHGSYSIMLIIRLVKLILPEE
jgi:hypothetical protein